MKTWWAKTDDNIWHYRIPLAVIGVISASTNKPGKWWWNARIMCDCQINLSDPSPQGYATSFEGAKKIVEVLCQETGTIEIND